METNKDNKLFAETINIIPIRDIKTTNGNSGLMNISTGRSQTGRGGDVTLTVGNGDSGIGGDVKINGGFTSSNLPGSSGGNINMQS